MQSDTEMQDNRHMTALLRLLLRRLGVWKSTLLLTVLSVIVSVLVTYLVTYFAGGGEPGVIGLSIAMSVPMIVAPIFTYQILRLAVRLDRAEVQLQILATTDPLTRAFNRRHFVTLAEKEFARVKRYGGVFSVMIFDIDDFKHINDTYGHGGGDQVLVALTEICRAESRASDVFARYGGEEFVFLLPEADLAQAVNFAERIRRVLSETTIRFGEHQIGLTVSIGIATYQSAEISFDNLLTEADGSLYRAKREGKNRVEYHAT